MTRTYLGKKGYTIFKKNLDTNQENEIKKDLYVKPFIPKAMAPVNKFPIYRESSQKYYLPRFYGIEKYGLPEKCEIDDGEKININFNGSLRDYQESIVTKYCNYIGNNGGGLLEIDTGLGKTVIALNIISKIKLKTLVIVHKEFLLNQWEERIKEFLPNAKIGKIQGQKIDIIDKDIVIGMLQSLSMKDYEYDIFKK